MLSLLTSPVSVGFALAYKYDDAFDTKMDGYDAAYDRAVNTLDFAPITLPGQRPTLFHFKPMTDDQMRRLFGIDEVALHTWLAFRVCLDRITGAAQDVEIEHARDPEFKQFGKLVPVDVMNAIGEASRAYGKSGGEIINQLGGAVLARYAGTPFSLKG